jgi:hypothetical protein
VNPAAANRTPPTRPCTSAWLDTSITTAETPEAAIPARSSCSAGASGVVRTLGSAVTAPSAALVWVRTVPISPVARPAAARPASTR